VLAEGVEPQRHRRHLRAVGERLIQQLARFVRLVGDAERRIPVGGGDAPQPGGAEPAGGPLIPLEHVVDQRLPVYRQREGPPHVGVVERRFFGVEAVVIRA